jgi:DNA-binding NarL/FixJ family response regulator
MILVFVVGAVRLYRDALTMLLARSDGVRVVGSADIATESIVHAVQPDVFVVDAVSHDAAETTRTLVLENSDAKVVAIGVPDDDERVMALVEAGVGGFVLQEEGEGELAESIKLAARGEVRCSPRMTALLAQRVASLASVQQRLPNANLTARELEIVELIDRGMTNKEIARILRIEIATVKNHVHNILEKLQVSRRAEAAERVRSAFRTRRHDRIEVIEQSSGVGELDPSVRRSGSRG